MTMKRSPLALVKLFACLACLAAPRALDAQGRPANRPSDEWAGWSVGAALGRSGNEDEHHESDDRGLDVRGNLEVPLGSRLAARVEGGRVAWRYDEYGTPHLVRQDVVSVRRLTASLLFVTHPANPVRGHIGGGLGLYHWRARVGTIEVPITRGVHFAAGVDIPVRRREWAVTGEVQTHVINAPNRTGRPGPEDPVSGSAVMSITFSVGFRKYW